MKVSTAISLLLTLIITVATDAADYRVRDLGIPAGFELTRGTGLNDHGDVVGWAETAEDVSRAFLFSGGTMRLLETGTWEESLAAAVNNRREIVGAFRSAGTRHAFLWRTNQFRDLGVIDRHPGLGMPGGFVAGGEINDRFRIVVRLTVPDGNQRTALWSDGAPAFFGVLDDGRICHGLALNNRDHIVGQVFDTNAHSRPFLWRDGEFVELGSLGGSRASATAVNDAGTVIGWAVPKGGGLRNARAFVWTEAGGLTDIGTLGGRTSRAYGVNERGQVVGYSATSAGGFAAFIWENGRMTDLNERMNGSNAGWRLSSAVAVNEAGQILALGKPAGAAASRAVLLEPDVRLTVRPSRLTTASRAATGDGDGDGVRFNLRQLGRHSDGSFRLGFDGLPGRVYAIEVSTTLRSWTRLGNARNVAGRVTFTDERAGRARLCFYRAVLLPAGAAN